MPDPVRPTTPEPLAGRDLGIPRWVVPVGAVAVLGLVFWIAGLATGGDPAVTTTLDVEALATTSTTAPTTTAPLEGRAAVHRRAATAEVVIPADIGGNLAIEGLSGYLVTVTGQSSEGHTLNLTPVGTTVGGYEQIALPAVGRQFSLDASGRWLGFIGGDSAGASDLSLVPLDGSERLVLPDITSFAWESRRARSLGWFNPTEGRTAEYQRASLGLDGSIAHFLVSVVEGDAHLLAVDPTGMWRTFPSGTETFVAFTDGAIGEIVRRPADLVSVSTTAGAAMLGSLSLDDWGLRWSILAGSDTTFLPWAPSDAFTVGWRERDEVAFVGLDGAATAWVEVWSVDGAPLDAFRMQYRVWDIAFSPDGRFLVMPGTDNQGTHAALLYDLDTRSLTAIVMDDWVQFAALILPPPEPGLTPGPAASAN